MKKTKRLAALCAAFLLGVCPLSVAVHAAEAPAEAARETALPPGTGKVAEVYADETGRKFYTIQTPAGNIFYLIIDFAKQSENVYFLDAVAEKDLIALAEKEGGTIPSQMENSDSGTEASGAPTPVEPSGAVSDPERKSGNGNLFSMILVAVIVVIGGGAGLYFTIVRKKRGSHSTHEEYEEEYISDESETDSADYGTDSESDLPPWEEDDANV